MVVSEGHYVNPDLSQAAIIRLDHTGCAHPLDRAGQQKDGRPGPSTTPPPPLVVAVDDPTTCINLISPAIDVLAQA
ncbi:hypothetical protein [Micromonospora sp. WMMD1274]|uniref:hypothetical protein n=1 Tax=Micromonospora sp. WMMD1274 TaxID=3404116 RepID=UPI003B928CEB